MNRKWTYKFLALMTGGLIGLAGCGGSGGGDATGYLSVGVSDGPLHDATKVCIAFREIEVKRSGGAPETITLRDATEEPIIVNLLEYQGAHAASLLYDYKLLAGQYQWLRLGVLAELGGTGANGATVPAETGCDGEGSFVAFETSGTVHNLYIPSGAETGLQFSGFIVPVGGVADLTAEWDLPRSLPEPPGLSPDAILRPHVRLVDNTTVGTLAGEITDTTLITDDANCDPSVYLYDGEPTAEAIESSAEYLAMAMVQERMNDQQLLEYHYEIGFVPAGDFKVAFSCDDGVTLTPETGKAATVTQESIDNNEVTVVDLP